MVSGITDLTITVSGLTAGVQYEFTVEARNSYGFSLSSELLTLLCAYIPEPPATVTTANLNSQVVVSWDAPVDNGYAVSAFKVLIQEKSTTFTLENVECDGFDPDVVANRQCSVSLATLTASPYLLVQGDSVIAKVAAINIYGESVLSTEGSGAVIWQVPDAPILLANVGFDFADRTNPEATTDQ